MALILTDTLQKLKGNLVPMIYSELNIPNTVVGLSVLQNVQNQYQFIHESKLRLFCHKFL